jgi:hypothetical protein
LKAGGEKFNSIKLRLKKRGFVENSLRTNGIPEIASA